MAYLPHDDTSMNTCARFADRSIDDAEFNIPALSVFHFSSDEEFRQELTVRTLKTISMRLCPHTVFGHFPNLFTKMTCTCRHHRIVYKLLDSLFEHTIRP